jgi:16S rRNA (guanine(966)-N(2))-methyltransferase RsmD
VRVIAGSARGRRLSAPKGRDTRPTPDRVREALFSILGERVSGATVLDLFAGTGALGIESLSRGAARAVFVEAHRQTAALIEKNLGVLGAVEARVLSLPAARALSLLGRDAWRFDIAFLDPPFDAGLLGPTLAALAGSGLMAGGAIVVCEHPGRTEPPVAPPRWKLSEDRRYGEVALALYEPQGEPS